jgi:hypothetical protein
MTDAIKARYRESGEDELAASKVLFEIAVFLDEQSREDTMRSEQVASNTFEHLLDECMVAANSDMPD